MPPSGHIQVVSFRLGDETYAIDIEAVQEIIRLPEITRLPRSPHFALGVVNLRGRILPVVDLGSRMGLPAAPLGRKTRLVVARLPGAQVGLVVDHVREVMRLEADRIEAVPPLVARGLEPAAVKGVVTEGERLLILLDLARLFLPEEEDALAGV